MTSTQDTLEIFTAPFLTGVAGDARAHEAARKQVLARLLDTDRMTCFVPFSPWVWYALDKNDLEYLWLSIKNAP